VVVDAGAHHGVFSILYAKWVTKSGKIYAFECNAQNYEIMLKNIEINGIRNIEPQFLAVGDSAVDLMMPEDSAGFLLGNRVSTRRVSQIRLDDYFREKGVFPTFLKIDVEGYELNVLEGAQNILRRKPKVLIEFHNFAFQDPRPRAERILAFLGNYHSFFLQHEPGMAIHRINNRKELIDTIVKHHNPHLYVES
jgi:FkbM family methyltransferase